MLCSPPTPGSTLPSTPMLSTSAGWFFSSMILVFVSTRHCLKLRCYDFYQKKNLEKKYFLANILKLVQLYRFLTWAFHIFFYDIAYEPEGWPWKPVVHLHTSCFFLTKLGIGLVKDKSCQPAKLKSHSQLSSNLV